MPNHKHNPQVGHNRTYFQKKHWSLPSLVTLSTFWVLRISAFWYAHHGTPIWFHWIMIPWSIRLCTPSSPRLLWLIDGLKDGLIDGLIDWLIDGLIDGQPKLTIPKELCPYASGLRICGLLFFLRFCFNRLHLDPWWLCVHRPSALYFLCYLGDVLRNFVI